MQTFKDIAGVVALWVLTIFGLGALFAIIVMWLWNAVMPDIFGLKVITYWQALCISWLSAMLVNGMATSKRQSESYLEDIRLQSQRQGTLLQEISEFQSLQLTSMREIEKSLQSIESSLDNWQRSR